MRRFRGLVLVGLLVAVAVAMARPALAQVQVIGNYGVWEVFGGSTADGLPVCGTSTTMDDGRYVGIKYWQGRNRFTIHLTKRSWNIPAGTRIPVAMQFDQEPAWTATASGNPMQTTQGGLVEFTIPFERLEQFLKEFRNGNVMTLQFTAGSEPGWRVSLQGSYAASVAMSECVRRLGGNAPEPRPYAGGPTQPFGGTVPAPVAPPPPSAPAVPMQSPPRSGGSKF